MAYKFQLGAFTASGSIKAEEGFDANEQNISNVGSLRADDIRADSTQLTVTMDDNQSQAFYIQEGSNVYMNFDTSNGSEKIDVVQDLKITDDKKLIFGTNSDASFEYDEDGNDVLLYAGANIRIPDDTKIEFGAGGDAGIEYDENGTDQLRIHGATAGIVLQIPGGDAMTIDSSANVTIAGNLTVQGETTTVDSTTINISSSFTFEGPADAHETVLHCGTPTQDLQVNLPQFSASAGAATYHLPVLADATTAASAQVTAAEFALLDGGSSVGTTALASGDGFLHNDNGTMKHTQIDKIADLFAGSGLAASSGVMSVNIDGLSALGGTGLHQTQDHFMFSDNGTEKKITFSNLQDAIFADVSGDAAIAAGGALTVANDAIESGMLNDNVISGQTALGSAAAAQADELLFSDGGTLKKITFSNLEDSIFGNVSGDATVAAGGALTIAAGAVEHGMLAEDIISGQDELAHADIADADELMISDAGTIKRVGVDSLQNHYFGNVSGDATIADGGALTIAADAIESGMLNDNVISGQTELAAGGVADADELLISDGGVLKKIGVDSFRSYVNAGSSPTAFGDGDATLAVGVNYASANTSAARTLTLPASPTVGQSVKVKVAGVSSGAITIARAGSQTIDGSLTSIVLESDNAAVELVYVAADDWRVF